MDTQAVAVGGRQPQGILARWESSAGLQCPVESLSNGNLRRSGGVANRGSVLVAEFQIIRISVKDVAEVIILRCGACACGSIRIVLIDIEDQTASPSFCRPFPSAVK